MVDFPADRIKVFTATTSTGTSVALGAAVSNLFMTAVEAGLVDGHTYDYVIEQGTDFEHNSGVYSSGGGTIARGTPVTSKIGGTVGTSKINLNGTAVVYFPFFNRLFAALSATADWADIVNKPLDTITASLANANLVVNGGMDTDQVFKGVAQTAIPSSTFWYGADQWLLITAGTAAKFTGQQVTDAPAGFSNSLKFNVTTADASVAAGDIVEVVSYIEGTRVAKLGWGAAGALPITIGVGIRANRTGTYGLYIANPSYGRSYPHPFTINAANTWEYKTFTVPGDTTGTWPKDTGAGLIIGIVFMCGTTGQGTGDAWGAGLRTTSAQINGVAATSDTFQISAVSILPGLYGPSQANSPLLRKPFSDVQRDVKRYFEVWDYDGANAWNFVSVEVVDSTHVESGTYHFEVEKRIGAAPGYSALSDFSTFQAGTITSFSLTADAKRFHVRAGISNPISLPTGARDYLLFGNSSSRMTFDARM